MNNRPVNLDLRTIRMPISATLSILHRITGVILFFGMPILLWMFGKSLGSVAEFQELVSLMDNLLFKLMFLGILFALGYHIIAGIKHLVMDRGIGETLEGAKISSRLIIVANVLLIIFLGAQI